MSKYIVYGNSYNPLTWKNRYSDCYYDHFRAWDADSLTLNGVLVDKADSLTGSGRSFIGLGGSKPTLTHDIITGKDGFDFDGISEYMDVLGSTNDYNFLHNSSGGTIIIVAKNRNLSPNDDHILGNHGAAVLETGFRTFIRPSNTVSMRSADGTSNVMYNESTNVSLTNKYNSIIEIYDCGNATANERGNIILNGISSKNNLNTGVPSVSNAGNNLRMGARTIFGLPARFFNGIISEILIFNKAFDAVDIADAKTILNQDYGTFPIS